MEKIEISNILRAFGNGNFLEEVDNSYEPEPYISAIMARIRDDVHWNAKRHPEFLYWKSVTSALLEAKENFSEAELDELLRLDFNIYPSAVKGVDEFFVRLAHELASYMDEASK